MINDALAGSLIIIAGFLARPMESKPIQFTGRGDSREAARGSRHDNDFETVQTTRENMRRRHDLLGHANRIFHLAPAPLSEKAVVAVVGRQRAERRAMLH